MDKSQVKFLISSTFENSFNKEKFTNFMKNLLNYIDFAPFTYQGNYIPDAFKLYIHNLERIGKYYENDHEIDILIVRLKKESSIERARTMQRNFIAWYLNGSRGGKLKDAALAAFVPPDEEDWRFSLVKMDYRLEQTKTGGSRLKEEFTPARRWSFLVGKHEKSHTAQSRLAPILADVDKKPTLKQLEDAFNIEKVTKEFFDKYRDLFYRTKEELDKIKELDHQVKDDFEKKEINTVEFAKKLLGQIVFLYFLQKKGWFGVNIHEKWGSGSRSFLRNLFEKKHSNYDNFYNDILEPLFYEALRLDRGHDDDYYSKFNCKIPFLNGGLFDPLKDYDWVHTDIKLPDELFSNDNITREGDIGDGILDIFDRYNFTVNEDEPLEKEVAIDPEMLGKVFENLLEVKDRKSKGTYYTPREIVHYMCQQSLINYLYTELNQGTVSYQKLDDYQLDVFGNKAKTGQLDLTTEHKSYQPISKEEIETFIKYGEQVSENEVTVETKGRETERYYYKIPENIRKNAKLIDEKLANIKVCDPAIGSGAFPVGMMSEIVRTRNTLSSYIKDSERTIYNFKRECIEKSLYGVDIDPGAVEIAKLRLWLSLVVDEEDIKQIRPLPNLDYKIVCGNSLLGVEKGLYNFSLFSDLEHLKPLLFNETNPSKKQEYKKQIDNLISQITNGHKDFDFEVYFSEVFHEKKGFDIVIANPPYVEHKKLKSLSHTLKNFNVYSGTADLYVYFYEVAFNALREKGILTFISSNKFIRARYGSPLRDLLAKNRIYNIVDFTKIRVFDALVASCIVLVSKDNPADNVSVTFTDDTFTNNLAEYIEDNHIKVPTVSLGSDIWQLEDKAKLKIKDQIESGSKKLSEIQGINVYRGITTGYNPVFIISEETKSNLLKKNEKNRAIIKPLLQGRNIKKWLYKKSTHYLLQTGFDRNIKNEFPQIFSHLSAYEKELKKRDDQGRDWWNLRACRYYPEFEKEKIIWGLTADKWAFAYDNEGHYLPSNGYILTSSSLSIKYLLALMNSKLMEFYFGFIGIMTAGGAYTLKHETIANFPIKELSRSEQQSFVDLIDKILAITKDEDCLQNPSKQAKVKELEREIDQMVYKIYGLTPKEIEIIEIFNKDKLH